MSREASNLVQVADMTDGSTASSWRVQGLELTQGFVGAVAAPAGNWSVVQRLFRYEDAIGRSLGGNFSVL